MASENLIGEKKINIWGFTLYAEVQILLQFFKWQLNHKGHLIRKIKLFESTKNSFSLKS